MVWEVRQSNTCCGYVPLACSTHFSLPAGSKQNSWWWRIRPHGSISWSSPDTPHFFQGHSDWRNLDLWSRSVEGLFEIWFLKKDCLAGHWAEKVCLAHHLESDYRVEAGTISRYTIWALDPALPGAKISLDFISMNNQVPLLLGCSFFLPDLPY